MVQHARRLEKLPTLQWEPQMPCFRYFCTFFLSVCKLCLFLILCCCIFYFLVKLQWLDKQNSRLWVHLRAPGLQDQYKVNLHSHRMLRLASRVNWWVSAQSSQIIMSTHVIESVTSGLVKQSSLQENTTKFL